MRIAFIGCGHVFDYYMSTMWAHPELEICGVFDINESRTNIVGKHYDLHVYQNIETLLNDSRVQIVINLTNIGAHYEITKQALEADKHVYSEKPLTTEVQYTKELFSIAKSRRLVFSGAPCNIFSDSVNTMWKAIIDGAIGKPALVYAELDDSPLHVYDNENSQGPTGAPWPYVEELEQGCTFEHIGYHLVWICAIFGPVTSVTAFSKLLIENKTDTPLSPSDTPDYSVGCLNFANGVTVRITCSIVAPRDHRMRIIGNEGEILADSYSHYQAPVFLERYSKVSLNARKARTLRNQPWLGSLFGVGGNKVKLIRNWKSKAIESAQGNHHSIKQKFISWLRRRETHSQDKMLGIAEMAKSIKQNKPQFLSPDFLMHINEITLIVQRAGSKGTTRVPTTTFKPLTPPQNIIKYDYNYLNEYRLSVLERILEGVVEFFHKK